jgi:REP element-mobilizing transposase RayT
MPEHFRVRDGAYPHFVTSTIVYWIPVFSRDDYCRVLIDSLNYCIKSKGLLVHGYVLMSNHFHAILSQVNGRLPEAMRDLKRHTSVTVMKKLEADGREVWRRAFMNAGGGKPKVWDEAYHPEQVHSRAFFEQKLRYMHDNPVRAGCVVDPCHWKYSSAGFYYADSASIVEITPIEW